MYFDFLVSLQSVEEHQVREVLKCIIHTILFNRALGHVAPRDMDCQLINVSYVEVDDDAIEKQVNASLRDVEGFLLTHKARSGGRPVRSPSVWASQPSSLFALALI